jgi:hypothetical protein
MGSPQLGFPRLRLASGRTNGIAIGPEHTPSGVTVRQESSLSSILATRGCKLFWVVGARGTMLREFGIWDLEGEI